MMMMMMLIRMTFIIVAHNDDGAVAQTFDLLGHTSSKISQHAFSTVLFKLRTRRLEINVLYQLHNAQRTQQKKEVKKRKRNTLYC